jgi:hypothetical protein
MALIENLADYLEKENPFPALNLLEAALVCRRMPGQFDQHIVEQEIRGLSDIGALRRTANGIMLHPEALDPVAGLLNQYKKHLRLSFGSREETAESFLSQLTSYLAEQVPEMMSTASQDGLVHEICWQAKKYRLQIALSPAWLPAVAEDLAREQVYLAVFGPFAAQKWNIMHRYYTHPEFRNFTGYFDPWQRLKMNISRGGLFTYFDWFFRDVYGLKFFIPEEFSLALQNFGLLRYNDEK